MALSRPKCGLLLANRMQSPTLCMSAWAASPELPWPVTLMTNTQKWALWGQWGSLGHDISFNGNGLLLV